jgi:hypothetical protein
MSRRIKGGSGPSDLKHQKFIPQENGGESHQGFPICEITTRSKYWRIKGLARARILSGFWRSGKSGRLTCKDLMREFMTCLLIW